MLRGIGSTSSVIHAAGAPGAGDSAAPNALVVLVKTNASTPDDISPAVARLR